MKNSPLNLKLVLEVMLEQAIVDIESGVVRLKLYEQLNEALYENVLAIIKSDKAESVIEKVLEFMPAEQFHKSLNSVSHAIANNEGVNPYSEVDYDF